MSFNGNYLLLVCNFPYFFLPCLSVYMVLCVLILVLYIVCLTNLLELEAVGCLTVLENNEPVFDSY